MDGYFVVMGMRVVDLARAQIRYNKLRKFVTREKKMDIAKTIW